ncbi:MAG TPA: type II secretion system protein [Pirellulales bacterium]|nr:type II secretion system protein [Pirellulales bacterium]
MKHRPFKLRRLHPAKNRGLTPPARLARRAFTLVELLIVIVIIGMLAALITAAAARAVGTAKRTQITLDLDQFETAFQSYRNDTSGNFPPDLSYPPQGYGGYLMRQNRIMQHLRKAYPRTLILGYGVANGPSPNSLQWLTQNWFASYITWFNAHSTLTAFPPKSPSGDVWGNVDNLDPGEAMVFWLGGMPIPTDPVNNGTGKWLYKMQGFSANKQTPFGFGVIYANPPTNTIPMPTFPNDARSPGPYEFAPARLGDADGDGWPEYYPPGAAVPQPPNSPYQVGNPVPPYVYFDAASYDSFLVYDSTNTNGVPTYPSPYPMNAAGLNNGPSTTMTLQPTGYLNQWGLAVPYAATILKTGNTTGNVTWVNDKKFQVISAGLDAMYASIAAGTTTRNNFPLFPTPQQLPALPGTFTLDVNDAVIGEPDNLTNFFSGTLFDGSQP